MIKEDLIKTINLSSVPLRQLNKQGIPENIASGCLINFKGKKILLSVQHATGNSGNWVIENKFISGKGTECYALGNMHFLSSGNIKTNKVHLVDFSFVSIPNDAIFYFQGRDSLGNIMPCEKRIVFDVNFFISPCKNESYGFAGGSMPEWHPGNKLVTQHIIYTDLKFSHTKDDLHSFALPISHPGHEYFKGCSGAPIIDTNGNIVALICGGNKGKNNIYGISLKEYYVAIDAIYGDLIDKES